ncbi:MAG: hypothetical protein EX254_09515 [Flavobacteriaceae bacterium]|nr:nuclear transport factor 2 family protein [Bacteroidia bacterium]NND11202.1 hypothetical protein [Flavobacteriaceae bacterium]NNL60309.1 hypothetical protein [Flavobacteriaceae bacterium]RZV60031.1 MAG: hypothetical protein EX254_09515 [Flavobacteriaceae bacterium]
MKQLVIITAILFSYNFYAQEKDMAIKDVEAAAFNYIDVFYKADTTLAYKSIHKDLRKVGWYYNDEKKKYSGALELPFDKLIELAKRWNAKGDQIKEDTPRKVKVLEVSDKIAVAKVTAAWGIDYLNMVNTYEGWKIINIVWQSKPKFSLNN